MPGPRDPGLTPYIIAFERFFADDQYEVCALVAGTQVSKALAISTPLPTPTGWTTMGDVRPGDQLFADDGRVTTVTGVSSVMVGKPCFRVEFCDGSHIVASDDHLWTVEEFQKHRGARDRQSRTLATQDLIARGVLRTNGAARYSIRLPGALQLPVQVLPIAPYVLGVWLGNGNSRAPAITEGAVDAEEMARLLRAEGVIVTPRPDRDCWRLALAADDGAGSPVKPGDRRHITGSLRRLGLIANKHIPASYLRASSAQRLALLQGMMDTDGTVQNGGAYCSKLEVLAKDFVQLAASLGFRPRLKERVSNNGYKAWVVYFHAYHDTQVFRLRRKQDRLADRSRPGARPWENERRYIRAIEPIESVPVRCIAVDSPSRLFLAGERMVPTHNTDGVLDVMGWRLDTKPRPQLYVGPSKDFVTEQFEPRLMKLFDEAATLKDLVARGKRNKKFRKTVNGVSVRLAWAGSETSLASDQAGDVYVDEYDKMGGGLKGTGDAFTLAKARADTYRDRKIAVTSTPKRGRVETEKCRRGSGLEFWKVADTADLESPIWVKWQSGTRHHFAWRCPHCEGWFIPRMRDLKAPKDATPAQARRETFLCCPISGCVIEEKHKAELNRTGVFVAPGQIVGPDGALDGDPPDSTMLSLWVSGLASPFVTWGERVEEVMLAELTGDDEAKQGAINKAGELFAPRAGAAPPWATVRDLKLPYGKRQLVDQVVFVTAGVDVQKRRLYFVIRGWGARQESWLLDHGQLWGSTAEKDIWVELAELLNQPIGNLSIRRAFIDSGFRPNKRDPGDEHRVYEFARRHSRIVYACKGYPTRQTPLSVNRIDVAAGGGKAKYGLDLVRLDSDFFKSWVHERVQWPVDQPGGWHLFDTADDDYCKQIVSEARERGPSGRVTWNPITPDNHYLDCFDPQTELLTEDGWLPVAEATPGMKFATVNLASDEIEYQAATAATSHHHSGEMIAIRGRRIDALVTPNHRMVTYRRNPVRTDAHITRAEDLTIWHTLKLTARWGGQDFEFAELDGRRVDAGDWAELLGWFVACGHRRAKGNHLTSIFSHAAGPEQDRLKALIKRLGFEWRHASSRQIVVTSKALHFALGACETDGAARSSYRKIVPRWVSSASPRLISRFVDAAMAADGSVQRGFRTFVSTSKALADGIQELMIKLGRSPNLTEKRPQPLKIGGRTHVTALQFHVSEAKTEAASLRRSDNSPIFERVPYRGPVHCVAVPNGTLIARRNGKMMIVGNCEALAYAAAYMLGVQRLSDEQARAAAQHFTAMRNAPPNTTPVAPAQLVRAQGRRVLSPGI